MELSKSQHRLPFDRKMDENGRKCWLFAAPEPKQTTPGLRGYIALMLSWLQLKGYRAECVDKGGQAFFLDSRAMCP